MATGQPGPSPLFPSGQARQAFSDKWGSYTTVAGMPNGSGNVLTAGEFKLEAGDRCYLAQTATAGIEYICVSAGTAAGGDAVWVPGTGQGPWSSVLYVDPTRGSDVTGARGNANLPFATIQAAINAMTTGDTVACAPVVIISTVAITVPATVLRGGIAGAYEKGTNSSTSPSGTVIRNTTGTVFDLGANLGLAKWTFANLTISASFTCIAADGSAYARNGFLNGTLILDNVFAAGTTVLSAKYVVAVSVGGGQFSGIFSCVNGGRITFTGGSQAQNATVTVNYDAADPLATTALGGLTVQSGSVVGGTIAASFVTWSGQAGITVDATSAIGGLKASGLSVSGASVPSLVCCGYIGGQNSGVLDLASAGSEIPDTATALTIDFRGTRLYGLGTNAAAIAPVTTFKAKVGGAAGNFQTVKLDSTTALPCTFTADAKIHLTARGADFASPVYTTPGADGDVIPPSLTGIIDISAGGAVAKTWVQLGYAGLIRTGAACDTAFLTESAAASDPFIAAKATTGLTITSAVVAGDTACNWLAIWK